MNKCVKYCIDIGPDESKSSEKVIGYNICRFIIEHMKLPNEKSYNLSLSDELWIIGVL